MLVTALGYGNTDENVIAELQAKLSTKTEVSPESERIYFLTMAFLNEHRYQDALNTVIDYNRTRSYENISIEKLVIDLRALRDSPQDFETNIEITRGELSYVPHWGGHEAFLEFCWQLWPKADTADKKHKLLESITEGYEAGADRDIASQVCDAAARITGEANGVHVTNQGYFLSEVAQSEAESGSKMLARELYKELCARFPSDLNWGVYKYNYGLLLEQTGYPARAEVVLKELINSNVNDEDPGGSLMQTNQNYRHEAAILISKIRLELGDAQGARDWRYLSIVKYKFVSWCGTCSWAEASRDSSDLFIASVASGPIQVVRYFILYPWNLSFALLIAPVPLVIVVRRTRRRRKKAKMDSSGSMNETSSND
ncbi:MAG TPA: hypothetical protein VFC63_04230 [Blastocatellia bacterium]|nr:hypothetical protein [Blastocatellia bacterium]